MCLHGIRMKCPGWTDFHYTSVECRASGHTEKAETKEIDKATYGSSEEGSEEIKAGRGH